MAVTDGDRPGPARAGRVDWRAVADGAVLTVAVTLPPTIVVRLLKDSDLGGQESNLWFIPLLALLAGGAMGGHRAARRRPDAPLLHAAAAATAAFVVLATVAVARRLVAGDGLTVPLVVTLLLLLQITVSLGVIGGYRAMRRSALAGGTERAAERDTGRGTERDPPAPPPPAAPPGDGA